MSTASTTCSTANPMLGPLLRTMHRSLASADQCALRRDATMLVLVSGGSDSVGLLRLAAALRDAERPRGWGALDLHALFFDHRLRPREETEAEERLVEAVAASVGGVTVHTRHYPAAPAGIGLVGGGGGGGGGSGGGERQGSVGGAPTEHGGRGMQARMRAWRQRETALLARQLRVARAQQGAAHHEEGAGGVVVATAHHADDQSETLLLKWLRGCHLSRLQGMAWRSALSIAVVHGDGDAHMDDACSDVLGHHETVDYIRPLLGVSKQEIRTFLLAEAAGDDGAASSAQPPAWLEDKTNALPKGLRNRVRLELLPLLRDLSRRGGGGEASGDGGGEFAGIGGGGGVDARLRDMGEQSAQLREFLDAGASEQAPQLRDSSARAGAGSISLRLSVLTQCKSAAVRSQVLHDFLTAPPHGDSSAVPWRTIRRIDDTVMRRAQRHENGQWELALPGGRRVVASNGVLECVDSRPA